MSGSLIYMSTMPMCMYKCANDDISPSRRLAIRTKLQGKKDNLNRLSRRRKNFHKSANKNLKSSESSSSGLMAGTSASKLSVTAAPVPRTASRPKSFCSLDSLLIGQRIQRDTSLLLLMMFDLFGCITRRCPGSILWPRKTA